MYRYIPDEIDQERAHHQAVKQDVDDPDRKRIGNLGELAFEQFCREYLPVELWGWNNEAALRWCRPESFSSYDFEVFGYEVDVKTSRDVAAFRPESLLETDSDDDIIAMVWHRDVEDSLILLGWERVETLASKVEAQAHYDGDEPAKLEHLAVRPMNELLNLGPNTAYMNQKPENPFRPGDRVIKSGAEDPTVAVVVDVLPPEKEAGPFGQAMDGEAVNVAFPASLDEGPGDWRTIHPALLASYCDDQDIKLYTYKHTNLEFAPNPFTIGDRVIKRDHEEPDLAFVVEEDDDNVSVAYSGQLQVDAIKPKELAAHCDQHEITVYSYSYEELEFAEALQ